MLESPALPAPDHPTQPAVALEPPYYGPCQSGLLGPWGAQMKAEGQLSSPGVRLPGVLALSLPLDQVNGALCACYLSARWDQHYHPANNATVGLSELCLAHSKCSINGDRAKEVGAPPGPCAQLLKMSRSGAKNVIKSSFFRSERDSKGHPGQLTFCCFTDQKPRPGEKWLALVPTAQAVSAAHSPRTRGTDAAGSQTRPGGKPLV